MRLPDSGFLRSNAPWLSSGVVLAFSSAYGQTFFISVFAGEIQAEYGLSHAAWGSIYSIGTLLSAFVMVWAGALIDRMRVRSLGALVLLGLAAACLAMATVSAAWALVPVIFALRFFGQGMSSHIAMTAMARWFTANRGKALSITTLGFALGESLLPLVFVSLKETWDWRLLWILAASMALCAVPILFLLLRQERTPASMPKNSLSPGMGGQHWTRGQAIRHPLFWSVIPVVMGPSAFITALFFQQVHLAGFKGWSHAEFVALFPIYTGVSIVTMLISGFLIDRFGTERLLPFYQIPLIAGFCLMGWTDGLGGGALAMAFMALSLGAFGTVPAAFWAEFYGAQHVGSIKALAAAMMVLGSAIGPVLTGILIDQGIPFAAQMPWLALFFALSCLAAWLGLAKVRVAGMSPAPKITM